MTTARVDHCLHTDPQPVVAYTGDVLGYSCLSCFAMLPPTWGCPLCTWEDLETICPSTIQRHLTLTEPCPDHV